MNENLFYKAVGDINPQFIQKFELMENTPKSVKIKNKWLLPTVAAIPLFITVCYATGLLNLSPQLSNFLGINNHEQGNYLSSKAFFVDQFIQQDSGTIHIKEVIGDNNLTYIFFDFIAPNNVVLDKNYYQFVLGNMDIPYSQQIYNIHMIDDDDKTDNKISFAFKIQTEKSLSGKKIELFLSDLYGYDNPELHRFRKDVFIRVDKKEVLNYEFFQEFYPDELDNIIVYDGNWSSTPFKVDFNTVSSNYTLNQKIEVDDVGIDIKTINISPLSITISGETFKNHDKLHDLLNDDFHWDLNKFTIHYLDGLEEKSTTSGSFSYIDNDFIYTHQFLPITDKQIIAITYLGQRIDLPI